MLPVATSVLWGLNARHTYTIQPHNTLTQGQMGFGRLNYHQSSERNTKSKCVNIWFECSVGPKCKALYRAAYSVWSNNWLKIRDAILPFWWCLITCAALLKINTHKKASFHLTRVIHTISAMCPRKVWKHLPVSAHHSLQVLSKEPVAILSLSFRKIKYSKETVICKMNSLSERLST